MACRGRRRRQIAARSHLLRDHARTKKPSRWRTSGWARGKPDLGQALWIPIVPRILTPRVRKIQANFLHILRELALRGLSNAAASRAVQNYAASDGE
jgi:hypothetical protein